MLGMGWTGASAKEEIWRHESFAALNAGTRAGVVVAESGRVWLGPRLSRVEGLEAARVWALVMADGGTLWAATGDQGRIYRRAEGNWELVHDAESGQVLSLAAGPGGRVAAGTGPGGRVIELDQAGQVVGSEQLGPEVAYVWGLAYAGDGSLLAATGPQGQLWRRPAGGGPWALLFDARQPHLLSIAVDEQGVAYVGTDAGALIYRITPAGDASVVLDAPQEEIRTLRKGQDGSLLAGTASEPPGGSAPRTTRSREMVGGRVIRTALQGTTRLKAGSTGENVVYRIEPGGPARELFRFKGMALALAERGGRILVGAGPEGRLFEMEPDGRDPALLARLDHGQVLTLAPGLRGGEVYVGVGDPGGVYRLESGYRSEGTLTSEVLDAGLPARFGLLSWRGEAPEGTDVGLELRTGQSGEPDATWSGWKAAGSDVPNGRFAQYRLTLKTDNPKRTPEVTGVLLAYRTLNLAPEVGTITVPDLTAGDGATRKTKLELKWEASDPNGDPMIYRLEIRKEDWPDWVAIPTPGPLTEKSLSWDATTVPPGRYRLRVTASDERGNPEAEALEGRRETEPFVIDHEAPRVVIERDGERVRVVLEDQLTRLTAAEWSVDGGEWRPLFALDGLFDSTREELGLSLRKLGPGPHVLMVRATDAAGNVGSADLVFTVDGEGR
jgi:hypothetical protein